MRLTIFVFFFILLILINSNITHSIYKRNEYDYPRSIIYPYKDLLRDLQRLRELKDPEIDRYLSEIENAINQGDYDRLLELLRQLRNYLYKKGYDTGEYDYVSILMKLLEATKNAGVYGLEIDFEKLDPYLRNLIENSDLRNILISIDLDKLLSLINEYGSILHNLRSDLSSKSNWDLVEKMSSAFSKSTGSMNTPIGIGFPQIPFNTILFTPSNIIILSIIVVSIISTIFLLKFRNTSFVKKISDAYYELFNSIKNVISTFRSPILDPVVNLYNKWYSLVKHRGYRRNSYETLREFLSTIKDDELSNIGVKVTGLYEDRVYGGKEIEREIVERISNMIDKVEYGGND